MTYFKNYFKNSYIGILGIVDTMIYILTIGLWNTNFSLNAAYSFVDTNPNENDS